MFRWLFFALALPLGCATISFTETDVEDSEAVLASEAELQRRYEGGYYYYPERYYPAQRAYRPYDRGQTRPRYEYYQQPNYVRPPPQNCPSESKEYIVSTLESTMGLVERTHEGLQQSLMHLHDRIISPFQFPRLLLETARTATSMTRDLREVLSSIPNSCLTQADANEGESAETHFKERFLSSFENLKMSAKSLESAVAELFESPFTAFTNIGEVFKDLRDGLSSAMEAVTGDNANVNGDKSGSNSFGSGSTDTDSGFAAFTSYSYTDATDNSNTERGTSTQTWNQYSSAAAKPTTTTTSDGRGFTRLFTFTTEDVLTFTNKRVSMLGQTKVTREFDFTTAEYYQFTDTSVLVEDMIASPTSLVQRHVYSTMTSLPEYQA